MIYIKNYRALNSLLFSEQNNDLFLPTLIGKVITVFVDGGGVSGKGFTGILIDVLYDRIKLITSIPSAPMCKQSRNNKCRHCSKKSKCNFGTNTIIMIEHITAVTYNYV